MCKHVAATLYGVGARLDHEPELLFTLRGVDPTEMVEAAVDQPAANGKRRKGRILKTSELSSVFGIDIDAVSPSEAPALVKRPKTSRRTVKRKSASKKAGPKKAKTGKPARKRRKSAAKKARGKAKSRRRDDKR
jgi:uncharacterized Zn finger protein